MTVRVVIVTSSLPAGPVEGFVIPEILELRRQGHEVLVMPMWPKGKILHDDARPLEDASVLLPPLTLGIFVYSIGIFLCAPRKSLRLLRLLFNSRSPDILGKNLLIYPKGLLLGHIAKKWSAEHVHAYWAGATSTMALIAATYAEIPWSLTAYRWDIAENNLLRTKAETASFLRVCDRNGAAEMTELAGKEAVVIHSGVNLPALAPERIPGPFRLLMPANLIEKKGHVYLLEALARLKAEGLPIVCTLAGDGELKAEISAMAADLALDGALEFAGFVPHATLLEKMSQGAWDAVVLPSIETATGEKEGIPISLIEAMAAGLPIVSTPTGGIPELVEGAGLLVPQRDSEALAAALRCLATDPGLQQDLRAKGIARARAEYGLEPIITELVARMRDSK